MSSHFLGALVEFLIEKGFKRPRKTKRNREGQSVVSFGNCSTEKAKDRNISKEGNVDKEDSEATRKSSFALIGMRSVLRNMQRNVLSAVFFDTVTIRPSSVATTLGLYATSLQNTKVYAISGLNTALSSALNIPTVGAVGLMNTSATKDLCDTAAHSFNNVSISNKQKPLPNAITTELQTSTGKKNKKKKR